MIPCNTVGCHEDCLPYVALLLHHQLKVLLLACRGNYTTAPALLFIVVSPYVINVETTDMSSPGSNPCIVATLILTVPVVWIVKWWVCSLFNIAFPFQLLCLHTIKSHFHFIYFQGDQKTEISTALKWDGAVCSLQNVIFYATIPLSMDLNICEFCLKQLIPLSYSSFVCM